MNRPTSRPSGLDELENLTKGKLAFKKGKVGVSNVVAEQAEAINQLTEAYHEMRLEVERHKEELRLAETDDLHIAPIAKYMYAGDVEIASNILVLESGQEVEFFTTGIRIDSHVQENVLIRLTSGKKVTAVEVEFPSAPECNVQSSFIIDPKAPVVAVALALLNLLFDDPVLLPRRVLPMSKATQAMLKPPPPRRLIAAPQQRARKPKALPLPPELEVSDED
jgi:hypothetical protein